MRHALQKNSFSVWAAKPRREVLGFWKIWEHVRKICGEGLRVRAVVSRNSACRPDANFATYRIMTLGFVPDVK